MKKFTFLFALVLFGFSSFGQHTLTLEDAISVAAVHNLSIQQAGNNVQVSKNQASLGNAGLLPRLDLSLGSTISDASLQTAGGEVNSQTTRSSTRND